MTYDLLQRRLEDKGHTVIMVRNVTDVDEPIYRKAKELGEDYRDLARRETSLFQEVLDRLHFRRPSHEPLASNYIAQMADAVARLLDMGYAYRLDDDIYFDTAKDTAFGSFSPFDTKLQLGLLKNRGGDPGRAGKRQPLDFLLWKGIVDTTDPAAWDTPLGHGRPGWHIECSAMSSELLGTPSDIHGGGSDLIFPHHECEIAQTRALYDGAAAELSRHWLHTAPILYGGEKMSKSLGNLVFAKDLLEHYPPAVIRLALMRYHYRTGGEWAHQQLESANELLEQVYLASGGLSDIDAASFAAEIRAALDDDLDTHRIVHALETITSAPATSNGRTSHAEFVRAMELIGLHS